jgi:tetratricopeptide (TPR) repeat protein
MILMQRNLLIAAVLMATALDAAAQQHYKRVHNRMLDEANAEMAHGEYLDASRIYKKLIPVDTTYAEVFYDMGYCLARIPGQRERSYGYLEKAVHLGHTEACLELAQARHRQQRFDEAIDLFNRYKTIYYGRQRMPRWIT